MSKPFWMSWLNSGNTNYQGKVDFLMSTGRTGTLFFESFICSNFKNIVAKHEPKPDFFDLGVRYHRAALANKQVSKEFYRKRKGLFDEYESNGVVKYIESNPFLSYIAPALKSEFPSSKVVHLVRNPIDYIKSAIQKDPNNSGNFFMSDSDHRTRLNANDIPGDPYNGKWAEMSQFQRICWNWKFINCYISETYHDSGNYHLVKFEDLFHAQDIEVWKRLFSFLELPSELINGNTDKLKNLLNQKANATKKRDDIDFDYELKKNKDFYTKLISPELLNKYGY